MPAQMTPQVFDRIEFRAVRRLKGDPQVWALARDWRGFVPRGLIHDQQGGFPPQVLGEFFDEQFHAGRVGVRQNHGKQIAVARAEGAENIGVLTNALRGDDGADPARSPTRSRIVHPAETRFVLKVNAQRFAGSEIQGFSGGIQEVFEVFLKASCLLLFPWG